MYVVTDQDITSLQPGLAIEVMREALLAYGRDALIAPPRLFSSAHDEGIVLSAGALLGESFGFRAYYHGNREGNQVVASFDRASWKADVIAIGHLMGERRTGAIGGVAVDALSSRESSTIAFIGTGPQAYSQLWAINAVRSLSEVRVFSRGVVGREAFAKHAQEVYNISTITAESAEAAVRDADIVILSTSSNVPVIETDWIKPGAHVTTMGRKSAKFHECPIDLVANASVVVTDSIPQLEDYEGVPIDRAAGRSALSLSELLSINDSSEPWSRSEPGTSVFISVGLAGTEALLARRWVEAMSPEERAQLVEVQT
ncbi:MAG TPA: hypothetical protein PK781_01060 [Terrimesophilobacter sp.]|nr:hypothetical protein [Terrimesophilobacter sp.]HRP99029.1 hypothetical protein [Terrimesophilobacter sp.]